MAISEKAKQTASLLAAAFPSTQCFLNHTTDYELLFAVILSAQTTDKSVNAATVKLFRDFPTLDSYVPVALPRIQKDISSIGLCRIKSHYLVETAQILLTKYGGKVPQDRQALMTLPGVGNKTSGVILAELWDAPLIPVDTHILRVSRRLDFSRSTDPTVIEKTLEKSFGFESGPKIHRRLILLGRTFCFPRNPDCSHCPLKTLCPRKGIMVSKKKKTTVA